MLRYRSSLLTQLRTWFFALPLLFGWMDEAQTLCIPLAESFTNLRHEPAHRATIALVSPGACALQLYDASLTFAVRLGGLTRAMSRYFFASAAIGVGSLMVLHWVALILFELRPQAPERSTGGSRSGERRDGYERDRALAGDRRGGRDVARGGRGVAQPRGQGSARRGGPTAVEEPSAAEVAAAAEAAARGVSLDDDDAYGPMYEEGDEPGAYFRTGDLHQRRPTYQEQ